MNHVGGDVIIIIIIIIITVIGIMKIVVGLVVKFKLVFGTISTYIYVGDIKFDEMPGGSEIFC